MMKAKKQALPKFILKYFWGDDLHDLKWSRHQDYIAQTILEKGDLEALKWIFSKLSKKQLRSDLNQFKLSEKSKNFWSLYLS